MISLYNLNINVVTGKKSTDRDVPDWIAWGYDSEQNFEVIYGASNDGLLLR